jgi:NAD(P)-dependent dehydrogenase (short-subunit alcohol dehydrogenase family)
MRRALVTGGANGIGEAAVRRLILDGHAVAFCDRDEAAGDRVSRAVGAEFIPLDATDAQAVAALFDGREPFDILVNNVGADQHAFFTDTGPDDWRKLLAINLESAFAFTLGVLPAMQAASFGRIVNISSEAGRLGSKGGSVYAAAKAGLVGFTRSIARENARYGITVNAILPGPIHTPMVDRAAAEVGNAILDAMASLTLVKRLGRPEEVAHAIAFFCSDGASFITGETLGVSGGMGCGG